MTEREDNRQLDMAAFIRKLPNKAMKRKKDNFYGQSQSSILCDMEHDA